ncbi:MAG: GNAT family protein [Planctomycetota bacterium]
MNDKTIDIRPFEATDIPRLISWIPDVRFLLQWAGPQYKFPLDNAQLLATLEKTKGERPSHFMFKALRQIGGEIIGHVELMGVDYEKRSAVLGRVLIGKPEWRGQGYGKSMVEMAIRYAFNEIGLHTIALSVFDFNTPAIACYTALGFAEYERKPNARRFGEEYWNLIMMRMDRDTWRKKQALKTEEQAV